MATQRHSRSPAVLTGNRWEAAVSGNRTTTNLSDRKLGKGAFTLLNIEDVRELKELIENLESIMEGSR